VPQRATAAAPGRLRAWLLSLPPFPGSGALSDAAVLDLDPESVEALRWRIYSVLSFLSHAYLWCDGAAGGAPPSTLPAALAVPWCAAAAALDMPPVLTYASYNLLNWRRLDAARPVALGNIACMHNFLGGMDEQWFRLIHVDIEATAAPVISGLPALQAALALDPSGGGTAGAALHDVAATLRAMQATLGRMGERCDPYVYYHRVRRPMGGSKNNPEMPGGLVYEGLGDAGPRQYFGETGAQVRRACAARALVPEGFARVSSLLHYAVAAPAAAQSPLLHALDAVLGVEHAQGGWLRAYLQEMRLHMPPAHRRFIAALERGPTLRAAALADPSLRGAYNEAVTQLEAFRAQHKAFAFNYIARHAQREQEVGTGGSDFMPALAGYQRGTAEHLLL
jgi:indoleamine 2,3-dioxygenase